MFGKVIPEEEKSTCNNHDAVKLANSRGRYGAMVCGRHDMKRPLSVGDLQKGKRYLNMDYFVLSTLTDDTPPDLTTAVTENAVHLELARQEKIASAVEIRHDVSPSKLIAQGLQLEEAQVRLQCDINALGLHLTDLQHTKVQAQDNRIQRKIEAWIEVQKIYMPRTTLLQTWDEDR
ncbi:uncharacterized protein ARMOST_12934 [Armillaria ostoyae]|uniref:Uncharacterized protein n=1 Tax=Armillaria ostoyae TaxID=47428 RepID=A0A284RLC5_ARMOS|nr:uncharacterized protein ARMOST_12934 [Armillaria ostoyae]